MPTQMTFCMTCPSNESNIYQSWEHRDMTGDDKRLLDLEAPPADFSTTYPNACLRPAFISCPKQADFSSQFVTSVKADFGQILAPKLVELESARNLSFFLPFTAGDCLRISYPPAVLECSLKASCTLSGAWECLPSIAFPNDASK